MGVHKKTRDHNVVCYACVKNNITTAVIAAVDGGPSCGKCARTMFLSSEGLRRSKTLQRPRPAHVDCAAFLYPSFCDSKLSFFLPFFLSAMMNVYRDTPRRFAVFTERFDPLNMPSFSAIEYTGGPVYCLSCAEGVPCEKAIRSAVGLPLTETPVAPKPAEFFSMSTPQTTTPFTSNAPKPLAHPKKTPRTTSPKHTKPTKTEICDEGQMNLPTTVRKQATSTTRKRTPPTCPSAKAPRTTKRALPSVSSNGNDADQSMGGPRKKYSRFREKNVVCDICDKSFTLKQNVQTHIILFHMEDVFSSNPSPHMPSPRASLSELDISEDSLSDAESSTSKKPSTQVNDDFPLD